MISYICPKCPEGNNSWKFVDESSINQHLLAHEMFETTNSDQENDAVNHPSHYTAYKGLEIIDLTEQMNFNRGNAVKYIARAGLKDESKEIEDLEKAQWYLAREIERVRKENGLPS